MIDFSSEFERLRGKFLSNRLTPDDELLAAFESLVGQSLPNDFASFLKTHGATKIQARCPCVRSNDIGTESFFGFQDRDVLPSIEDDFDELGLAPIAISFAQDAFGGQFLIFLSPKIRGHIYFYDTEGAEDGVYDPGYQLNVDELSKHVNEVNPPDEFANFYFLATSFDEFIRGCQPVEP